MQKKCIVMFISFILLLGMISCSKEREKTSKFLIISAFEPYSLIVKQIGEKTCTTDILFSSEKDFSSAKLNSKQMRKIKKAQLIFLNGHIEKKYREQLIPYASKIVYISDNCNQMRVNLYTEHPYYWLDADLMFEFARVVNTEMAKRNPDYTATYEDRLNKMLDSYRVFLVDLDKDKTSQLIEFPEELSQLKNYLKFHNIIIEDSSKAFTKKISLERTNEAAFDLWSENNYQNYLDYLEQNLRKLLR